MGKIQITCNIDDSDKAELVFNVDNCSENDIANLLREIFTTVTKNKLVKPGILIQVLQDILQEMFKSGLGA